MGAGTFNLVGQKQGEKFMAVIGIMLFRLGKAERLLFGLANLQVPSSMTRFLCHLAKMLDRAKQTWTS